MISSASAPASAQAESPCLARASAALAGNDVAAALQHLQAGIAGDPDNPHLWLALGNVQLHAEDLAGAADSFAAAHRMAPGRADALALGALALKLQERSREAKQSALAALALDPGNSLALKVLARVQIDWGNEDLALAHCEEVLARSAADEDALRMREQCRLPAAVCPIPLPDGGAGYDAYVSLGSNCEAGLQFRRIGYQGSSFFRFTFAPFAATYAAIDGDFNRVFERENLRPHTDGMVRDLGSGIVFHSDLRSALDAGSGRREFLTSYDFDEIYGMNERPKIRHLVAKWRAVTQSRQDVLYFLKVDQGDPCELAGRMAGLFRHKYPAHRWTILCLQSVDPTQAEWGIPGVINRHVSRFAPIDNAQDADLGAWDRIFAEFPLRRRSPPARSAPVPQSLSPSHA
jgi:tetratricopeptide (TPR) repeat protein